MTPTTIATAAPYGAPSPNPFPETQGYATSVPRSYTKGRAYRPHETALIREALTGNTRAFDRLTETYRLRLLNTIRQRVTCHDTAEDILQESLLRAYTRLRQYDPLKGSFYTWLFQIAANATVDLKRTERNRPLLLSLHEWQEAFNEIESREPQPGEDLLRATEGKDLRRQIEAAIATMPDNLRDIAEMHYLADLSMSEIAMVLQIPIETLKGRLWRSRRWLQQNCAVPSA